MTTTYELDNPASTAFFRSTCDRLEAAGSHITANLRRQNELRANLRLVERQLDEAKAALCLELDGRNAEQRTAALVLALRDDPRARHARTAAESLQVDLAAVQVEIEQATMRRQNALAALKWAAAWLSHAAANGEGWQ